MGTRTMKAILAVAMVLVAATSPGWADTPATDEAAPAAGPPPVAVAQASAPAPASGALSPEALGVTQNATGVVYYRDDRRWETWVTIGSEHGLRPKAQVEFLRGGEVVAQGVVKTVKAIDAIVTPCDGTPAGTILLGDEVRVTCNGTRADLNAAIARDRREEMWGTLGISALLATCIFAQRYGWFQLD